MTKGYSCSVVGGREMNQDSFLVGDGRGIYAVADGVGGGLGGEIASKMAVDGLNQYADDPLKLRGVIDILQKKVLEYAMQNYGEPVMGTTLTAGMIKDYQLTLCHVGDSRCYLFANSILRLLTEDHEFYDEGVQGTVLASYLGIPGDLHPLRVSEEKFTLAPGNKILMCTDGLYRQLTESRMAALIREKGDRPEELVQTLCAEAATKPHSDNVTVVYVDIT